MKNVLKQTLLTVLTIGLSSSLYSQKGKPFQIIGTLPKTVKTVALLYYDFNTDDAILDSVKTSNGTFDIKGVIDGAVYAGLYFDSTPQSNKRGPVEPYWFYLNPGKNILDAAKGPKASLIGGDEPAQTYLNLLKELDNNNARFSSGDYKERLKEIEALKENIAAKTTELEERYGDLGSLNAESIKAFIRNNPNSSLSLTLFSQQFNDEDAGNVEWQQLFNGLSDNLKNSEKGQLYAKKFTTVKPSIGSLAKDFTQTDSKGNSFSLSSLKGKYVLVDFWASWCVPCRKENPKLVEAYNKYKNKNFEIVGVSLDKDKTSWEKAISDDKLTWIHVSDLKAWRNEVAQDYQVNAVPTNFLIDMDGKIIAIDLHGDELESKLNEIL